MSGGFRRGGRRRRRRAVGVAIALSDGRGVGASGVVRLSTPRQRRMNPPQKPPHRARDGVVTDPAHREPVRAPDDRGDDRYRGHGGRVRRAAAPVRARAERRDVGPPRGLRPGASSPRGVVRTNRTTRIRPLLLLLLLLIVIVIHPLTRPLLLPLLPLLLLHRLRRPSVAARPRRLERGPNDAADRRGRRRARPLSPRVAHILHDRARPRDVLRVARVRGVPRALGAVQRRGHAGHARDLGRDPRGRGRLLRGAVRAHRQARRRARVGCVRLFTLVPIRPRSRGERRSLRTFSPGVSLRPGSLAFNPDTPRRLSTPLLTPMNS